MARLLVLYHGRALSSLQFRRRWLVSDAAMGFYFLIGL